MNGKNSESRATQINRRSFLTGAGGTILTLGA